ncbi:hypothetical protein EG328_002752 [Venturia inaequalis]|uniref:WD40 repeat-like protein n=1 Tax=Venturia inaequalis TaxID=5025 RepID=A0A8H3UUX0_VENIN|nr:hypothetical protein EG328_002752 [Venturia inaequalis]RDI78949.1 hypothetical protein Vi05172_g11101 [Venturia inaequalis]
MESEPLETLAHPQIHCIAEEPGNSTTTATRSSAGPFWVQTARTAQWTPDGTSLITTSADNTIETIILPEDLLSPNSFHELKPYSSLTSPDPIFSTAIYPHFNLQDHNTTLLLYAARENSIKLKNALALDTANWAVYPLVCPTTEAWKAPHSLLFNHEGTHFIAGATAEFAIFDISRCNEGPMERKKIGYRKNGGYYNPKGLDWTREITGPNDIISTMDLSVEDMFALGTWGRKIAIYGGAGRGELVTTFSPDQSEDGSNHFGEGISQVKWSPCGRFLYVAERHSAGIHIYDIRVAGKRVGCLMGREAKTAVRLSFDVVPTAEGSEIWAGGTDGKIRMWKNPEQRGGVVSWDEEWSVHGENDLVCATLVHGSGSIVATVACKERYSFGAASNDSESSSSSEGSSSSGSEDEESDSESESECEKNQTRVVPVDEDKESHTLSATSSNDIEPPKKDSFLKIWSIS